MNEFYESTRGHPLAPQDVPPYLALADRSVPDAHAGDTASLDKERVERWRRTVCRSESRDDQLRHLRGHRGLEDFLPPLRVTAADPDGFEALLHSRKVGSILAINGLTTPCTVIRSSRGCDQPGQRPDGLVGAVGARPRPAAQPWDRDGVPTGPTPDPHQHGARGVDGRSGLRDRPAQHPVLRSRSRRAFGGTHAQAGGHQFGARANDRTVHPPVRPSWFHGGRRR